MNSLSLNVKPKQFYSTAKAAMKNKEKEKYKTVELKSNHRRINVLKDNADYRIERELNLQHFRELLTLFQESDSGKGKMDEAAFTKAFGQILGNGLTKEQMSTLFKKIDVNNDHIVDWDEFSSFMLMHAEGQRNMNEEMENNLIDVETSLSHRLPIVTPHKETIIKILYLKHIRKYVTCSREGTTCIWNDSFKLNRCYTQLSNSVAAQMEKLEQRNYKEIKKNAMGHRRWIYDCLYIEALNKFVTATDDKEITIYDFAKMAPEVRFLIPNASALCIDYYSDSASDEDESFLFFATDDGHINIFRFNPYRLFGKRTRKSQCAEIDVEKLIRKESPDLFRQKIHDDWPMKIKYCVELRCIISCSTDPKKSISIGTYLGSNNWRFDTIAVHKGVNTFAYFRSPVTLLTAGTDHHVRVWNPRRMQNPVASLKGHSSPVIELTVRENHGQVFSLSSVNVLKLWDIRKQCCLQTIVSEAVHRPENCISAMVYNSITSQLVVSSSSIVMYTMKDRLADSKDPKSHEHAVRFALYNPLFSSVVTGCDGGTISTWDAATGQKTSRILKAHEGRRHEITAMSKQKLTQHSIRSTEAYSLAGEMEL